MLPVLPCRVANLHGSRSLIATVHVDGLVGEHHRLDARLATTVNVRPASQTAAWVDAERKKEGKMEEEENACVK